MTERTDIATREDCDRLVEAFYGRAMTDPIIGFIFTDVARLDLEEHLPVISSFWETILLDRHTYGGGAFAPHVQLHLRVGLTPGHFERWLLLWRTTVDELFAGPRADLAKAHAVRVAHAFSRRLQAIDSPAGAAVEPSPGGDVPPGGLLVIQSRPG